MSMRSTHPEHCHKHHTKIRTACSQETQYVLLYVNYSEGTVAGADWEGSAEDNIEKYAKIVSEDT